MWRIVIALVSYAIAVFWFIGGVHGDTYMYILSALWFFAGTTWTVGYIIWESNRRR